VSEIRKFSCGSRYRQAYSLVGEGGLFADSSPVVDTNYLRGGLLCCWLGRGGDVDSFHIGSKCDAIVLFLF
jgi:hypothetical protein